jgi:hypothetical protein
LQKLLSSFSENGNGLFQGPLPTGYLPAAPLLSCAEFPAALTLHPIQREYTQNDMAKLLNQA